MLSLLLPALIPSWRFFDRIGPAPCIQCAVTLSTAMPPLEAWREVRPAPRHVRPITAIARLFWNAPRNETLFLASCAERLLDDPSPERADRLWARLADIVRAELRAHPGPESRASHGGLPCPFLRVRIVEVTREGDDLVRTVMYVSEARRL